MAYIIISLILLYILFRLNKKYPPFKEFNRRNAGVVIFILAVYAINGFYEFLNGNSASKARPSSLNLLFLLAVYGIMYRPNTLRLIGVLKAYDGEPESWKFTVTLTSFFALLTFLQLSISLVGVIICTTLYWHIFYHTSISMESKNPGKSRIGLKFLLISISAVAPLIVGILGR